jgi:hypothetical protein
MKYDSCNWWSVFKWTKTNIRLCTIHEE